MKNMQGLQLRLNLAISYSIGFVVGMTAKNWWVLLSSLIITIAITFFYGFFKKLMEIWGIGSKNVEKFTRQQRRALARQEKNETR